MREPRVGGKKEEDELNSLKLILLPILISIFRLILMLIVMLIRHRLIHILLIFILIRLIIKFILMLILMLILILIPILILITIPWILNHITADPMSDQFPMRPYAPLPAAFEIGSAKKTPAFYHLLDHPRA